MPVAAAIAGAAVIGGISTAVAGSKAAKAQQQGAETAAAASDRATQAQVAEAQRQYDTTRADFAPNREVGYGALDKLAGMYGVQKQNADGTPVAGSVGGGTGYSNDNSFTTSPGYQFRRDEGIKALERTAASRGMLSSGGTAKAIARYADGVASSEYDNYASRLASLAGVGQAATGSTAAAGQAATGTIANAYGVNGTNQATAATNAGNARASSYANTGSAINGTVNNLASAYLYNQGGYGGFGGTGGFTANGSPGLY